MDSGIARVLKLKYSPVAVLLTDEKPESALQFKDGAVRGCVIAMLNTAAKGRTVVFDRNSYGCLGGGVGLGFGNCYVRFPGGIEHFLSTGNKGFSQSEMGERLVRNMPALEHGERYIKTPELAKKRMELLPMVDLPFKYVVFRPLGLLKEGETPKSVVFLANPDQLSALAVLANYPRETNENIVVPFGAGCHTIGIFPYQEDEREVPRAVIGMMDISVRPLVDPDLLSFTVPYRMFLEMESNVEGSFLEEEQWKKVAERIT